MNCKLVVTANARRQPARLPANAGIRPQAAGAGVRRRGANLVGPGLHQTLDEAQKKGKLQHRTQR